MRPLPCSQIGPQSAQRARFEALRERVFEEMSRGSARWRLQWVLPIHLLMVGLLVVRGESTPRAVIQIACMAVTAALFIARVFTQSKPLWVGSFFVWIATYFLLLATTGGLASPLHRHSRA